MTKRVSGGSKSKEPPLFAFLIYPLYTLLLTLLAPLGVLYLTLVPRYWPLRSRFNPPIPIDTPKPLWIHACSVGEVNAARPLIAVLRHQKPNLPILLTVSTITGRQIAEDTCQVPLTWFPLDHPRVVKRFLRRLKPRALVLMETELWPAVLAECHRQAIPVALLNGRISEKHVAPYRRLAFLFKPVLRRIALAAMQTPEDAARIVRMGALPAAVQIVGNVKFDGVKTTLETATLETLRTAHAIPTNAPVIVFGSTRPGDEALAAECWKTLSKKWPTLRFIIAPRHLERLPSAMAPFHGIPHCRSSEARAASNPNTPPICFLDTMGELNAIYGLATIAVIGGSFFPGVEGHNPIEPAALGIPTVFGTHMANFAEPARILLEAGGAMQISHPDNLAQTLDSLLADPDYQTEVGQAGRNAILANQGTINRQLVALQSAINLE